MQSSYSDYIAPAEWRWVLLLASLMMLAALFPFAAAEFLRPSDQVVFGGLIHDIPDSGSAIAAMRQSAMGEIIPEPLYTPEAFPGMLTDGIYIILGRLAQVAGLDVIAVFHVARALAALLMVHAIYLLSAVIWQRIPIRRTFSAVATFSGGLGWVFGGTWAGMPILDTTLSPLFPFHVSLMNVHLPLAITCLCLLAASGISVLRPGSVEAPSVTNYGLRLLLFSLVLMGLYPPALLPFAVAFIIVLGFHGLTHLTLFPRNAVVLLWFGVPALPLVGYLLAMWGQNPLAFALWLRDTGSPLTTITGVFITLSLPLVLAAPSIWRISRRLEANDSALMLFWLVLMFAFGYGMPILGSAFWAGMMIPLAYFVTRGIQEFWLVRVRNPVVRMRVVMVILPLLTLSHAIALLAPLATGSYYVPQGYIAAFNWIARSGQEAVVMAAPQTNLWIPMWTGQRVMYSTPEKTLNPINKLGVTLAFYQTDDPQLCAEILNGIYTEDVPYAVRYIVVGPWEEALGGAETCLEGRSPVFNNHGVRVYRNR